MGYNNVPALINPAHSALIEPEDLAQALRDRNPANIRLLDASFGMPGTPTHPHQLYRRQRIGNAAFFDIDIIADQDTDLPHMLPLPDTFERAVSGMGIGNEDLVIIYDQNNIAMAAARAWWTFRVFGHDRVMVLNGGLPAWIRQGLPVKTGAPRAITPTNFIASFRPWLVSSMQDMVNAINDSDSPEIIVDARSPDRYSGNIREPRPGLRQGHIPGSINIPFMDLIDPATGKLQSRNRLQQVLASIRDNPAPITSYCGSGVTACVLALALFELGRTDISIYDGSWAEWGSGTLKTPIERTH